MRRKNDPGSVGPGAPNRTLGDGRLRQESVLAGTQHQKRQLPALGWRGEVFQRLLLREPKASECQHCPQLSFTCLEPRALPTLPPQPSPTALLQEKLPKNPGKLSLPHLKVSRTEPSVLLSMAMGKNSTGREGRKKPTPKSRLVPTPELQSSCKKVSSNGRQRRSSPTRLWEGPGA